MDEAKSLVNMAVAAMFASMFLAAAMGLIGLSYMLWGYYSREDAANQKMSDYANYTAFDNTTVRGQEVVQLIADAEGDFFVAIFDGIKGPSVGGKYSIDNMSVNSKPILLYTAGAGTWMGSKRIVVDSSSNTNQTLRNLLSAIDNYDTVDAIESSASIVFTPDTDNDTIQTLFLSKDEDATPSGRRLGIPDKGGYYAAFKSTLIYDDDGTSDILGVALVRQAEGIDQF